MDLVFSKSMCPICGLEKAVDTGKPCADCESLRTVTLHHYLSFIKGYALGIKSVGEVLSHGRNFLGTLQPWEIKRIEELSVNHDDLHEVSHNRMNLEEFLKKYAQRKSDRWHLLRYIIHGMGESAQYLPFEDASIAPKKMFDCIRMDAGDQKLTEYYSMNRKDAMERARQTANKIFFSHKLEQLQAAWDDGEKEDSVAEATDFFGVAQSNNDWWSAEVFARFFKHIGDMRNFSISRDLKNRNWSGPARSPEDLAKKVNAKHHM